MDQRPDAELLSLARNGDDAAFGVLSGRYARGLLALADAVVRDQDSAEDVCQEALFRAWRRIADCRDPARVGSWLGTIVRRQALDFVRKRPAMPLSEEVAAAQPDAHQRVERAELGMRLRNALKQLTTDQRSAVLLFDLEDWPHARIAETLETTEAMSRQHLMLGRRRLRQLLEGV